MEIGGNEWNEGKIESFRLWVPSSKLARFQFLTVNFFTAQCIHRFSYIFSPKIFAVNISAKLSGEHMKELRFLLVIIFHCTYGLEYYVSYMSANSLSH